jgi:F-type H+-transporting ATPase subunit delta
MSDQMNSSEVSAATRQSTVLDDTARSIALVYAEALYNAALAKAESDSVLGELLEIGKVIDSNPRLLGIFSTPVISRDEKAKLLKDLFLSRSSSIVSNFLMVLNEHDRLELIAAVVDQFEELDQARKNQVKVQVITAVSVSSSQEGQISVELEKKLGKKPIVTFKVDESILGGMIVRSGDWLWDDSLKNRLSSLRNQLIERSTYEIQSGRNSFSSPEGN